MATMRFTLFLLLMAASCATGASQAQSVNPRADLANLKIAHVEITKAAPIEAGLVIPPLYPGAPTAGPLPAHCRVDGVIDRRKGADAEEFGIGFAVALPAKDAWNGDFMMQGGGGGNGMVNSGEKSALARGFVVASTDTGHKAKNGAFDFTLCAISRRCSPQKLYR